MGADDYTVIGDHGLLGNLCMSGVNGKRQSDWRVPVLALVGFNLLVPLLIGGLIAVAESGDMRVLSCAAGVLALCAVIERLRHPRERLTHEGPSRQQLRSGYVPPAAER